MGADFQKLLIFLFFSGSILWKLTLAVPVILPFGTHDPEEGSDHAEGDMVLSDAQKGFLLSGMQSRNGLITETRRWPDNTVKFKISDDFSAEHKAAIFRGIETLETYTCVKFLEAGESDTEYVAIEAKPGGCYTAVGYQQKVQEMNLEIYPIGEGCFRPGTILHEFMHALGFYHQQSSAIRDDYIKVNYENIIDGKQFNFQKYSPSVVTDFDLGYDYESCLHYRPGAFSINGEPTIVPLDPNAVIGQRLHLSSKDISKINIMYKCPILV